jgi:hypothetical protein
MKSSCVAIAMLLVFSIVGCGDPKAAPSGGTVTHMDKPVPEATVLFTPTSADGMIATGKTDAQGTFTLTTKNPGDGAVPGNYTASVSPKQVEKPEGDYSAQPPPPFPAKYLDPSQSDLKVTIPDGGDKAIKLDLK